MYEMIACIHLPEANLEGTLIQKNQVALLIMGCVKPLLFTAGMGVSKNVTVRLLGTRFKARNCICEPGPQEPYRDIFFETPCR
jgi:hypothetical protein